MWAGMIHLAIGNALIGLLEGFLLVWLFRVPRAKAVGAMIAANYTHARAKPPDAVTQQIRNTATNAAGRKKVTMR